MKLKEYFVIERNILKVSAIVVFCVFSILLFWKYRLGDDSYIYLQYVKNIISHQELSFNTGTKSYGFTSPLWLFLLTIGGLILKELTWSPIFLGFICNLVSLFIWLKILGRIFLDKKVFFLFCVIVALEPVYLKHTFFGMETALVYLFSTLILLLLLNKTNFKNISLWFGLFILVRPESILLYLFFIIYYPKNNKRDLLIGLILFSLVNIPWLVFAKIYFNDIFTTTFMAKAGGWDLSNIVYSNIKEGVLILSFNYLPLLVIIFFYCFKQNKKKTNKTTLKKISLAICILMFVFYCIFIKKEFIYSRYFAIFIPFGLLYFAAIIDSFKHAKTVLTIVALWFFCSNVFQSYMIEKTFIPSEKTEDEIINWVNKETLPVDKIAYGRIGKLAFYTDRKIIDPQGIINPDIIKYDKRGILFEYYYKHKPDYFISGFYGVSLDTLKKYSYVEERKRIIKNKSHLIRTSFQNYNNVDTIKIYKINWY